MPMNSEISCIGVLQLCQGKIDLNVEIKPSAATPTLEGMTEAEYASKANMTQSGISRRRKKTLSKLKKLLNIMGSIG